MLQIGIIATVILLLVPSPAAADLYEPFETAEITWRLAEADCPVNLAAHRRSFQQQRSGQGSEFVHLRAGSGTKVYLSHDMPAGRIIDELSPAVWVKSDRPGIQLMIRVVLPQSPVGEGEALKTLLRGDSYTDVGNWQQLRIGDLPKLLSREVAMLRTRFGSEVNSREAYADLVVLNVYGGSGDTRVWIDDLRVTGIARAGRDAEGELARPRNVPGTFVGSAAAETPSPVDAQPMVAFQGDRLSVEGRPRFVRAVQHSGEPLAYLQGLGFNAVRLAQPATRAQLAEARELGLWLIAPPPIGLAEADLSTYDGVIVWDAGSALAARDLEAVRQRAAGVRAADPLRRPVLTVPRDSLWKFSGASDIVGLRPADQPLTCGELELASYGQWFSDRRHALAAGVAAWAVLPTQVPESLEEQWRELDPAADRPACIEPQQLHLLAYQALAAGARGLLFTSRARLDAADASSGLRANLLQCLNQQLSLLEPWVAGGDLSDEFEVSDPRVSASLLRTERSTLALLTKTAPAAQYIVPPMTPRPVSLVVRGVPASSHAFTVTPIGMHTLRVARQGGMRIELERFRHSAVVMITHDPLVMNHLSETIRGQRRSAARARRELVARQLALTRSAFEENPSLAGDSSLATRNLEQAESYLRRAELLLDAGDEQNSVGAAAESLEFIAAARRDAWQTASRGFASPTASPACLSFGSLPVHWQLSERLQGATWARNRLPAGNMEDLGFLQQSGWQQHRSPREDIDTLVELTPQAPRGGEYSLRMAAAPRNSSADATMLEQPAIEIRSATVPVRRGQLVQIRGWAKATPAQVHAGTSPDATSPLVIYDNFSGKVLAQAIPADGTWREFVLYRAATSDGDLSVTLSLRGFGEAVVDDVTVVPLLSWGLE